MVSYSSHKPESKASNLFSVFLVLLFLFLQAGRLWVRFPLVSLEFFINIMLLSALSPWVQLSL